MTICRFGPRPGAGWLQPLPQQKPSSARPSEPTAWPQLFRPGGQFRCCTGGAHLADARQAGQRGLACRAEHSFHQVLLQQAQQALVVLKRCREGTGRRQAAGAGTVSEGSWDRGAEASRAVVVRRGIAAAGSRRAAERQPLWPHSFPCRRCAVLPPKASPAGPGPRMLL